MALQPQQVSPHRESPPGKSVNEMSQLKTDEWLCLPSRHSSDRERREKGERGQLIDWLKSLFNEITFLQSVG